MLYLANGWNCKHRPFIGFGFQNAPCQVILMPSGHNKQLPRMVVKSSRKNGVIPIPHLLAVRYRVGFIRILYRVIYDCNVNRSTRKRTAHTYRLVKATVSHGLKHIHVTQHSLNAIPLTCAIEVSFGEYGLIFLAINSPLY